MAWYDWSRGMVERPDGEGRTPTRPREGERSREGREPKRAALNVSEEASSQAPSSGRPPREARGTTDDATSPPHDPIEHDARAASDDGGGVGGTEGGDAAEATDDAAETGDDAAETGGEGEATEESFLQELPTVDDARGALPGDDERERDRELVRRAQEGDRGAFRDLYEKYHRRAYAVAFGVVKARQDALDIVQEAFVRVHRHLPNFQGTSSFYTWLYRIVMNLSIDIIRRRKTSRPVEYDDTFRRRDADAAGEDTIVPKLLDQNPRKTVIRRELIERIEAALAELPEYHRQAILLREVEGLSYEEMAEVMDVPKGTIMSRLFHARKKMQAALASYVDGDLDIEEEA